MYVGYNGWCTEDYVYKSYMRIFVRELVLGMLDINNLVMDGPAVSNTCYFNLVLLLQLNSFVYQNV